MKKVVEQILLVVLIILSLATATTKLIQVPAEMDLFKNAGFSITGTILFGAIQLTGGLLLIGRRFRPYGAIIMVITFVIATAVVFSAKMIGFGMVSLLFIALAVYQWKISKTGDVTRS